MKWINDFRFALLYTGLLNGQFGGIFLFFGCQLDLHLVDFFQGFDILLEIFVDLVVHVFSDSFEDFVPINAGTLINIVADQKDFRNSFRVGWIKVGDEIV